MNKIFIEFSVLRKINLNLQCELYFKPSKQNPVKHPKDRMLLTLATHVYEASSNQEELLPYIIKDNPPLPVVKGQLIKITAQTGGQIIFLSLSHCYSLTQGGYEIGIFL